MRNDFGGMPFVSVSLSNQCDSVTGFNPQAFSGAKVGVFVAPYGGETFDHGCLTTVESESHGY